MRTDELDFHLPPELIAQAPVPDRAGSRLLHYQRGPRTLAHHTFSDLPALLRPGDLLVFNDARVIPARLSLRKPTGGLVEGLFLAEIVPGRWRVLLRNIGAAPVGYPLRFDDAGAPAAIIAADHGRGEFELSLSSPEPALDLLGRIGRMPLPPYIKRHKQHDRLDALDAERYQTVYARAPGSVAAPTAGLHFTAPLLAALDAAGVQRASLTLHVGMGTFKPILTHTLEEHPMHAEAYSISADCAEALNRACRDQRRLIAVGTTSARVLESQDPPFAARQGHTNLLIHPPYRPRHVGALITNFHLPRSTLIALVAAFVGLEEQRRIYAEAIQQHYRFFSYGDACFLE